MNSISQRIEIDTNSCGMKMPRIDSLKDLISHLRDAFETDNVDIEQVQTLMKCYKSNPHDWKQFAKFDQYRYTRNLVDEGNGKYNLMILCWGEGHGSAIHDHADAHCFMKILHGSLSEVRYAWPEDRASQGDTNNSEECHDVEGMKEISRNYLKNDSVCYMNDDLGLHRVENPSHTQQAVSLHLYCPPFNSCSMFDQRTGHQTKCQVTFWTKYGEKVSYKTDDPASKPAPENN